jgi:hypothetical protein
MEHQPLLLAHCPTEGAFGPLAADHLGQ